MDALKKIKTANKVAKTLGYKNTLKLALKYRKLQKALKKRPRRK